MSKDGEELVKSYSTDFLLKIQDGCWRFYESLKLNKIFCDYDYVFFPPRSRSIMDIKLSEGCISEILKNYLCFSAFTFYIFTLVWTI